MFLPRARTPDTVTFGLPVSVAHSWRDHGRRGTRYDAMMLKRDQPACLQQRAPGLRPIAQLRGARGVPLCRRLE